MSISGLKDLYVNELQEARSFEALLAQALPKMGKAASEERLTRAFRDHAEETKEHQTDDLLSTIAEGLVNPSAVEQAAGQ